MPVPQARAARARREPSCSPTWSTPRAWPRHSATRRGTSSSAGIDRAIRAAVAEQGGEEVKATGDGFFLAFADADNAVEAAIAIQRRLAAHRDAEGFAPEVRIGIHQAEANRVGLDYAGTGVNQAARIGAAADGGEVLVSAATLTGARRSFGEAGRRTLELKGISTPVEVVSVQWR